MKNVYFVSWMVSMIFLFPSQQSAADDTCHPTRAEHESAHNMVEKPACLITFPSETQMNEAQKELQKARYSSVVFDGSPSDCRKPCLRVFHTDSVPLKEIFSKLSPIVDPYQGTVQSCTHRPGNFPGCKPVIYLYPTQPQETLVQLRYRGNLIAEFPDYDPSIHGWKVLAYPDGKLINTKDQREYSYLFWEGVPESPMRVNMSSGFVVPGKDTKQFLQEILPKLGLTPREYNEFIVYWFPKMQNNPYNLIHFAGKEYTDIAPLTISPTPQSLLRVFMVFRRLENPIRVVPQELPTFERRGFTVVEWGGTEID